MIVENESFKIFLVKLTIIIKKTGDLLMIKMMKIPEIFLCLFLQQVELLVGKRKKKGGKMVTKTGVMRNSKIT